MAAKVPKKKKKPATTARSQELEAAVLANPHADAPRLVYADWLQSQGDPRGELATLQHGLTTAKGAAWAKLKSRERALLDEHAAAFYGPLVKWPRARLTGVEWRSGFVDGIRCDDFHDETTVGRFIAEHPSARFIRVLDGVDVPGAVPPLLEVLRTHVARLDEVLAHPRLKTLESEFEALQLPKGFTHPALERLVIDDSEEAVKVLGRAKLPKLKSLRLSMRADDVERVAAAVSAISCAEVSLLADGMFDDVSLLELGKAQSRITELALRHGVDFAGARFPKVKRIVVDSGEGDGEYFAALHEALPALEEVDLRFPSDRVRFFRAFVTSAAAKRVKKFRARVSKPAAGLALTEGSWDSLEHLELSFDTTFSLEYLKAAELLKEKCWANVKSLSLEPGAFGIAAKAPIANALETLRATVDRPTSDWKKTLGPFKKLKKLILDGPRQLTPEDLLELGTIHDDLGIELEWAPRVA